MYEEVSQACSEAAKELLQVAGLDQRHLVVIGASSSEIAGHAIGSAGSMQIAGAVLDGLWPVFVSAGVQVAIQCCEHLNRALVVERETLERYRLTEVSAIPVLHAGGAVATAAYGRMVSPALAETITAHAGIDIGDTFIGMHLHRVAVPVRLHIREIGQAHVTAARTRPPLIGGQRAVYTRSDEDCSAGS